MRKLGTIDLEILHLAMTENGTFDETNLENSELKRLGVGKILDSLASLKDRKFISLNKDGSFSITDLAREILWNSNAPIWVKILRLLQIKSCSMEQITGILRMSESEILEDLERLRKKQFVMMSPQRQEDKIVKIYEIMAEGITEIDRTEKTGFENTVLSGPHLDIEIISLIDEILKKVQDSQLEKSEKNSIVGKLSTLKSKLGI
jgi:DNA-binding PadR family transcriptional regulator